MPKGITRNLTQEEELKIKKEYLITPVKTLAREIGVSQGKVRGFLKKNNLTIPQHIIDERRRNSFFKLGAVPANKGKKLHEFLKPETIEKFKKAQFKKGNEPHNTKFNGCVVSRADKSGNTYKYIRLAKGKWDLYHRVKWEEVNGPIPENKILVFKDGNSSNCSIDNLQLISREEHMLRNSKNNYPEVLIPTIALIAQLEKSIKSKQNG